MRKISLGSGSGYWGEPLDLTKELAERAGAFEWRSSRDLEVSV
jgi:hypothetical protein